MATEWRRRLWALAALPVLVVLAAPLTVQAGPAWWQPLAFAGQRVSSVGAVPGLMVVNTSAGGFTSTDDGRTFQVLDPHRHMALAPEVGSANWQITNGTVLTSPSDRSPAPDPRAPFLGATAHLIAAPVALPGVAVAVGSDGHVWRRGQDGGWATAFVLLPAGGLAGTPAITSLAAFTQPLSTSVYLATDGYGVLLSTNGGDDWIRADAGLPEHVLGLAAESKAKALYAATSDGLWVHHLQAFPAPPVYRDAASLWRWLGMVAVGLVAVVLAVTVMRLSLIRPRRAS